MLVLTLPIADSWGMHGDIGAGWWIVMVIMMVLFWGGILWGLGWLIRGATHDTRPRRRRADEAPLDILDRRLAEGAISPEEYLERRATLISASAAPRTDQGAVDEKDNRRTDRGGPHRVAADDEDDAAHGARDVRALRSEGSRLHGASRGGRPGVSARP